VPRPFLNMLGRCRRREHTFLALDGKDFIQTFKS
jgi:hypothetical protein